MNAKELAAALRDDAYSMTVWTGKGPDYRAIAFRLNQAADYIERTAPPTGGSPYRFDRYINGVLMAEGVTIENESTLEAAMVKAARIASRGPNGETPVLVLASTAPPPDGLPEFETTLRAALEAIDVDVKALRAAASRGPVSSREVFNLTDPIADKIARAALATTSTGEGGKPVGA